MSDLHDLTGENSAQMLIVTDEKGNPVGQATRAQCHTGMGKTHLAFTSFIINEKSEIILTKRSKNKSLWGGFWDASTISHVLPGETVEAASRRRGKEELGLDVKFNDLGAFYYREIYGEGVENEYCHVLVGESEDKPEFNPVEIDEVKYMTFAELKKDMRENPGIYTPWLKLALEKIDIKP